MEELAAVILLKLTLLMLLIVVKLDLSLIKQLVPVLHNVHVKDVVTSTVVMRLITSCIEPGSKSTSLVDNMQITKPSIMIGLILSKPGGSMEI